MQKKQYCEESRGDEGRKEKARRSSISLMANGEERVGKQ